MMLKFIETSESGLCSLVKINLDVSNRFHSKCSPGRNGRGNESIVLFNEWMWKIYIVQRLGKEVSSAPAPRELESLSP